ncbi:kinesin-like protein KIP1 [Scaptodrosophila lebanonensis]|uniref:Kinesin-like protein KIP1 n=1 Tax=Drosophila lebanonensis TaxID=7225 RepID=A0A6J2TNF8_DROLE|nr:kinesin-like protein KIP1 [Scaptodrosophila lebanonensis]
MRLCSVPRREPYKLLRQVSNQKVALKLPESAKGERHYRFRRVYPSASSLRTIYKRVAAPQVQRLLTGDDALLVLNGYERSGKNYVLGGDGTLRNPGILKQSLDQIFAILGSKLAPPSLLQSNGRNGYELAPEDLRRAPKKQNRYCSIFVSYMELENGAAYDLLSPSINDKEFRSLAICEDAVRSSFYVNGLQELEIRNAAEGLELYKWGQRHRSYWERRSTESQTIFNVRVLQAELKRVSYKLKHLMVSCLRFVGLSSGGELQSVDKALLMCLNQLGKGKSPSYGNSQLTKLLRSDLESKNPSINLIVCLNPADNFYKQNKQLLQSVKGLQRISNSVATNIRVPSAEFGEKKFDKLRQSLKQHRLQKNILLEQQKNLRNVILQIRDANTQLTIDKDALLGAYKEQQKKDELLNIKLKNFENFIEELMHNMTETQRDNEELKTQLKENEKKIKQLSAEVALAKERKNKIRTTLEKREQDVVDHYTRQIAKLRTQLLLTTEELQNHASHCSFKKGGEKKNEPLTKAIIGDVNGPVDDPYVQKLVNVCAKTLALSKNKRNRSRRSRSELDDRSLATNQRSSVALKNANSNSAKTAASPDQSELKRVSVIARLYNLPYSRGI